jgi:hypothetical protein
MVEGNSGLLQHLDIQEVSMSERQESNTFCCGSETYEIRVRGHLQNRWTERFECMTLTRESDGTTTLFGQLPDQTALHSVLLKIRNMNLKLISVRQVELDPDDETKSNC